MFCIALALSCLFFLYLCQALSLIPQSKHQELGEDEVVHFQQGNLITGTSKSDIKKGNLKEINGTAVMKTFIFRSWVKMKRLEKMNANHELKGL